MDLEPISKCIRKSTAIFSVSYNIPTPALAGGMRDAVPSPVLQEGLAPGCYVIGEEVGVWDSVMLLSVCEALIPELVRCTPQVFSCP